MSKDMQYMQGCALQIRHIISTSDDMQWKQVNHQVLVQGCTTHNDFPMNESLLLLIHQVKMASSLWQAEKSINYEIS